MRPTYLDYNASTPIAPEALLVGEVLPAGGKPLHLNRRANAGVIALRFKCKLSDLSAKPFFI
jgi:hypothetical protein